MRTFTLTTTVTEYASDTELPAEDRILVDAARANAQNAYAPYSQFCVGAALRLKNGSIVTGNNQENVAYPSGLCAERVAIYSAGALHPDQPITAMAISCTSPLLHINKPLSPCGACRQAIAEYEQRWKQPIRIIMTGVDGPIQIIESIRDLLPLMFEAEMLKKG
ncbi:MAG: cytidine deaminase [Bacteroidia bacterium]